MKEQQKPLKSPIIDAGLMLAQLEALGWTQDELAAKTGYQKRGLQKIASTGRTRPATAAVINTTMRTAWGSNADLKAAGRVYQDIRILQIDAGNRAPSLSSEGRGSCFAEEGRSAQESQPQTPPKPKSQLSMPLPPEASIEPPKADSDQTIQKISALLVCGGRGVYRKRDSLWDAMRSHAVSIVAFAGPQAPPRFANAMARKMRQLASDETLRGFEVYLVLDPDKTDPVQVVKKTGERARVFANQGVAEYLKVFVVEARPALNLDFMIIDDRHVAIGIKRYNDQCSPPEMGVEFRDRPELARAIMEWFEMAIRGRCYACSADWVEARARSAQETRERTQGARLRKRARSGHR